MAIPRNFLDEIKNRIPVSDIAGRKVKLTRRGREFIGLSPFKNERTPSFTVNDDKQFYHCFSSGKHGNVFDFLMETEGLSFYEAVTQLAAQAGMQMPPLTQNSGAGEQAREKARNISRYYHTGGGLVSNPIRHSRRARGARLSCKARHNRCAD